MINSDLKKELREATANGDQNGIERALDEVVSRASFNGGDSYEKRVLAQAMNGFGNEEKARALNEYTSRTVFPDQGPKMALDEVVRLAGEWSREFGVKIGVLMECVYFHYQFVGVIDKNIPQSVPVPHSIPVPRGGTRSSVILRRGPRDGAEGASI